MCCQTVTSIPPCNHRPDAKYYSLDTFCVEMMSIFIHFACKAATAFKMVNMVNAFQKKKWNQLDFVFLCWCCCYIYCQHRCTVILINTESINFCFVLVKFLFNDNFSSDFSHRTNQSRITMDIWETTPNCNFSNETIISFVGQGIELAHCYLIGSFNKIDIIVLLIFPMQGWGRWKSTSIKSARIKPAWVDQIWSGYG